jgi:hypothetical protein
MPLEALLKQECMHRCNHQPEVSRVLESLHAVRCGKVRQNIRTGCTPAYCIAVVVSLHCQCAVRSSDSVVMRSGHFAQQNNSAASAATTVVA